jgi:hypothetical protein
MSVGPEEDPGFLRAGVACTALLADPKTWINRRVETIEMLSHEETRRRVSIDFTLTDEQMKELQTPEGVVVPISVLTKEPRRSFDLRDEAGASVPVLGRGQNGALAHIALLGAASDALPELPPAGALEMLAADLRRVVFGDADQAEAAIASMSGSAEAGDQWLSAILNDAAVQSLLNSLWRNYVLFAVLPEGGPNRRVLKYSYGEEFAFATVESSFRDRVSPRAAARRLWRPDRRSFVIECPMAWRAASFHAEVVIPEELRFELAVLWDFEANEQRSAARRER